MKEKFKLMRTRPQVTEDEINALMDFDSLLKLKLHAEARRRRIIKSLWVSGVCVILTASLMFLFLPEKEYRIATSAAADSSSSDSPAHSLPLDSLAKQRTEVPPHLKQAESQRKQKSKVPPAPATTEKETKSTDSTLRAVYIQAEPVEGYPALYQYFADHLVYPASALKDSIEGVVTVIFVIDPSGRATHITIEKPLATALDQEAIRLVKTMPLWRSATYNGKPVDVKISLPITFSIQKSANHP